MAVGAGAGWPTAVFAPNLACPESLPLSLQNPESLAHRMNVKEGIVVPLLDLKAQYQAIRHDVDEAVARVIESQHFILGPEVSALEDEVASYSSVHHAIGMSSGTDALLAALMALDIDSGDEVITSTYSFFATGGVIARLGARPVFVDIDPETYNIDADAVTAAITDRTCAIMPVHLYGRMADMERIMAVAGEREIPVIEDAAQAIGSFDRQDRQAGSIGAMGCFSFFPSKNLGGFGDGGMTVTNDAALAHRLKLLRMHGSEPKYYHAIVGGNFRLDALQAAVLRVKLRHLDDWSAARRRNADRYRSLFADAALDGLVTLPQDEPGHIYNQFVIRAPDRDALQAHLKTSNVGSEIYYPVPLHMQQCFADLGYRAGDLPHAETAARETLALPVYPELDDAQLVHVVESIREFYESR
ncbi:MAG TPA: DegT/DnrJ/EryC1/StrS family aminotransferase [Longimicrobiales bacterium]|nr:DegT/DnrJ/EryC1/StrS family aminotransferase [Longimicrobiales bacterium]